MYYTYIIRSQSSGRFYTGSTGNLADRIMRHQQNRSKATKDRGPWILVYSRSFESRSEVVRMEFKIKKRGAWRFLNDINDRG